MKITVNVVQEKHRLNKTLVNLKEEGNVACYKKNCFLRNQSYMKEMLLLPQLCIHLTEVSASLCTLHCILTLFPSPCLLLQGSFQVSGMG